MNERIPEEYIHYLWQYGLFDKERLCTTDEHELVVINPGLLNTNSGPDFHDARIRIGNTEWAGNVEIHFRSSDWHAHNHSSDPAYDNVILHVVVHHDQAVLNAEGSLIPTLFLMPYLKINHFRK